MDADLLVLRVFMFMLNLDPYNKGETKHTFEKCPPVLFFRKTLNKY